MALSIDQRQLLEIIRQDIEKAGFPFFVSEFWQKEAAQFQRFFDKFGINDVEDEFYNTRFHGTTQDDPRLYEWFLTCYYRLLKQRDSLGLLDRFGSTLQDIGSFKKYRIGDVAVKTGYPIAVAGRTVSPDLLFTVNDIYNLLELIPELVTAPIVVGDLGAGWGRIGHLLLQINPQVTYVVFDIPESLVISSAYLPKRLPNASVCHYIEARELKEFDRETLKRRSIWFLGSHHLEQCAAGALDLVLNVASFQEMMPQQVNRYLRFFDEKLSSGCVYLRNDKDHPVCSLSQYQFPTRWVKMFFRDGLFSEDVFEAGFQVP